MTWTQLTDTPIWRAAEATYKADPRRKYHTWNHVHRLYHHAEHTLALPYDRDLDLAIMAHDVIYDEHPDKELRSAEWLKAMMGVGYERAYEIVMQTFNHTLIQGGDNRIVLLDLADLSIPEKVIWNRDAVMAEFKALYGISEAEFNAGNASFFNAFALRIDPEMLEKGSTEQALATNIRKGMLETVRLAMP